MTITMLIFIRHVWRGGQFAASVNCLLLAFGLDCMIAGCLT